MTLTQPPSSASKGDILVVDDTPENLALLSQLLKERGYKVRSVTKGSAGLRGAQAAPPDLILLDIRMPEMNGYEVCQRLKAQAHTQAIPVIFISALGEVIDKVKAFGIGGVDYITKPFQAEEVLARIETHLTLRRLQQQLQAQNQQLQQEMAERLAAQEKFTKAFRACPSPLAILRRPEGQFLEVNPSFSQLTGYDLQDILGRNFDDLHLGTGQATYPQWLAQLNQQGALYNQACELQTKTGETRTVLLSIEALELDDNPCTLHIFHDITEYKRLETQFISLVSHELRTPLNALVGSLDLLRTGQLGTLTPQGQHILDIAISNSERLIRLVNDILDLDRIQAGHLVLSKVECSLEDLFRESVQTLQSWADRQGITLDYQAPPLTLWADPDRLVQTLTNLLSNAIKFSEPGQTVWLRGSQDRQGIHLWVRDQGRGIPAEQLQQVFEPFRQVNTADAYQKGGTGLGLAICRRLVEQHQGRLWVESQLGQGSTFHILLPPVR
ncbi:ATP-binding protein [Synechocystis sp. LKSZ1]|uniref:hybrid sensor histidine kinase/response regulator n=1 Tax=Synechocystis sp. LKSZ1 TaxID=3144951 RepID=UPI00336BC82F